MADIVVVGQTPPPYHGQAIAIRDLLEGRFAGHRLWHIPMTFSRDVTEVGRFSPRKLGALLGLIGRTYRHALRHGRQVLYFPPAGSNRVAVYRDVVFLLACGWLFRQRIYHFHACGLAEVAAQSSAPMRALIRLAYGRPELALLQSSHNPPDHRFVGARQSAEVALGLPDLAAPAGVSARDPGRILMVSQLFPDKGLHLLVEAVHALRSEGREVTVEVVGRFTDTNYQAEIAGQIERLGLAPHIHLHGQLTGEALWDCFERAGIFCFPSCYRSESLGMVVIEAMRAGLPVVASRWRGVQTLVADGETGVLVAPGDAGALAAGLARLLAEPESAREMGVAGRRRFLEHYTREAWYARMAAAFALLENDETLERSA